MKILHVLTQLPAKTGSGVYFTNLIDSFNELEIENAAIYGVENDIEVNVNTSLIEEVKYNCEDLPFHICGMSDKMPYCSTIYSEMTDKDIDLLLASFEKKLIKMKKEFKPDLVISHHLFLVTDLVRKIFFDKKVVGISHGTDIRQIKKCNHFFNRLENIKNLDAVLTVTPAENEAIENYLGVPKEKIHLVGGGYNEKIFYPDLDKKVSDKITLMYAGKISDSKGVFELASTLPILEKKYSNLELHIVGNASDLDKARLLKNANYSKNLKIINAENQIIMANHLRKSDIFILPSYFEALGLIAIEALACHKIVVASEINGLKLLLKDDLCKSGIIEFTKLPRIFDTDKAVEEDKEAYVERLAEKIDLQISRIDKNLFTENISKRITDYSWKNIGKSIFNLIK